MAKLSFLKTYWQKKEPYSCQVTASETTEKEGLGYGESRCLHTLKLGSMKGNKVSQQKPETLSGCHEFTQLELRPGMWSHGVTVEEFLRETKYLGQG